MATVAEFPVQVPITMLCDRRVPLRTVWCYRPAASYAVTVGLEHADGWVGWCFARDLVADGLRQLAGRSDVWMWPADRGRVALLLNGAESSMVLTALASEVGKFLALTYGWVPAGQESAYLDVDAAVAQLLGGRS